MGNFFVDRQDGISSLDVVNYQLKNIIDDQYLRIQSQLTIASPDMDNSEAKNIKLLQQEGNIMIENNQDAIEKFCAAYVK